MEIWSVTKSGGPAWQTESAAISSADATGNPVVIPGVAGHRIVIDDILLTSASSVTLTLSSNGTTLFAAVVNGSLPWSPKSPIVGFTGEDVRIDASAAVVISGTVLYHLEAQEVTGTPGTGPTIDNEVADGDDIDFDIVTVSHNADDAVEVWLKPSLGAYALALTVAASEFDSDDSVAKTIADNAPEDYTLKARYVRNGVAGAFGPESGTISIV